MTPSPQLIAFLAAWEGPPSLVPRFDTVGKVWDIGYGHLCPENHPAVAQEWCDKTLRDDATIAGLIVLDSVDGILAQNEYDALASFVFNVGPGRKDEPGRPWKDGFVILRSGRPSTMRKKLNELDIDGAGQEFSHWIYAAGKIVPGLIKRRAAELAIFEHGDYGRRP